MNKQELIDKLKRLLEKPSEIQGTELDFVHDYVIRRAITLVKQLDEQQAPINEPEKPVVPEYVADFISSEQRSCSALSEAIDNMDMRDEGEVTSWFYDNSETFAKAWLYGYEVEKEKLYRAKNRHTGEYLCYCFEFYHDKNSSSRFTAEEKRWKELGYWGNDLYVFEEAEGEDE